MAGLTIYFPLRASMAIVLDAAESGTRYQLEVVGQLERFH